MAPLPISARSRLRGIIAPRVVARLRAAARRASCARRRRRAGGSCAFVGAVTDLHRPSAGDRRPRRIRTRRSCRRRRTPAAGRRTAASAMYSRIAVPLSRPSGLTSRMPFPGCRRQPDSTPRRRRQMGAQRADGRATRGRAPGGSGARASRPCPRAAGRRAARRNRVRSRAQPFEPAQRRQMLVQRAVGGCDARGHAGPRWAARGRGNRLVGVGHRAAR